MSFQHGTLSLKFSEQTCCLSFSRNMQQDPIEHDKKEVHGLEEKGKFYRNYCSHSKWDWSPCKGKGFGKTTEGLYHLNPLRYRIPFLSLKSWGAGPVCISQSEQQVNHMHQCSSEGTSDSKSTLPTCILAIFPLCCWENSQATQLDHLCDFYWLQCCRDVTWTH
jgi:hypothetical protein